MEENKASDLKTKPVRIKKAIGHEARTNRMGYFFILPFIIAFLVFNFWPTINTFLISFTDISQFKTEYTFRNAICPVCSAGLPSTATKGRGYTSDICTDCDGLGQIDTDVEAGTDFLGNIVYEKANCPTCNGTGNLNRVDCNTCKTTGTITPVSYNYGRLVRDSNFWNALKNTFIIWGMNFVPQLGIALILAIWLSDTRLNLVGRGLFRAVIYMPNLLMAASVALLFRNFFGAFGHVNAPAHQFLRAFNVHWMQTFVTESGTMVDYFNFFRNIWFTRGLVAFIQWWMWYGHTLIMLMAGITSISTSLYESAVVDGANSRQTAWYITLPLLRPMMLYILVTSMIGGMQMFEIPFLLTDMRGAPQYSIRTTVLYQYNVAFQGVSDRSYGSTISVGIFFITIFLAMLIYFFMQDRSELQANKLKAKQIKALKAANKGGAK